MSFSLKVVRDEIKTHLKSSIVQPVYVGAIPTAETLVYQSGVLVPYVIINFGDPGQGNTRGFTGPRGDVHRMTVNIFAVATDMTVGGELVTGADIAMDIQSNIIDEMLGFKVTGGGMLSKTPGGGTFVLLDDSRTLQAYTAMSSFQVHFDLMTVP